MWRTKIDDSVGGIQWWQKSQRWFMNDHRLRHCICDASKKRWVTPCSLKKGVAMGGYNGTNDENAQHDQGTRSWQVTGCTISLCWYREIWAHRRPGCEPRGSWGAEERSSVEGLCVWHPEILKVKQGSQEVRGCCQDSTDEFQIVRQQVNPREAEVKQWWLSRGCCGVQNRKMWKTAPKLDSKTEDWRGQPSRQQEPKAGRSWGDPLSLATRDLSGSSGTSPLEEVLASKWFIFFHRVLTGPLLLPLSLLLLP